MRITSILSILIVSILTLGCSNDNSLESYPEEVANVTIHFVDSEREIQAKDLDEAKKIIFEEYKNQKEFASKTVAKITNLQKEIAYSKQFDLSNKKQEQEYAKQLEVKYSNKKSNQKATNGILWNYHGSGFLSITTVPLNLKASKRDTASSFTFLSPGTVILCDKKWFRGSKKILISPLPGPTPLGLAAFDNKTDSFF